MKSIMWKMETNNEIIKKDMSDLLGGVCAGIAEYLDLDPTVMRVAYAVLTLFTAFCGIILYPVLWLIMPARQ